MPKVIIICKDKKDVQTSFRKHRLLVKRIESKVVVDEKLFDTIIGELKKRRRKG